jgi:geranylgeranyl diphosphate synthase type II
VSPGVQERLVAYTAPVSAAAQAYLAGGEPAGYLYDLVRDYPARAGKGLRSALLLATCQALGGSAREALAPALSLELLHNAFLVHDDVEDGSDRRRGAPTLQVTHGTALAVNAGDALAAVALGPLRDDAALGVRLSARLLDEYTSAVRFTIEGQALDLGWRRDDVVDLGAGDYVAMSARKTGWYTAVLPLRAAVLVATHGATPPAALTRLGGLLGVAFQIRDDVLDVVGGAETGKSRHGDVREGKRTLLVVHLLATARPAARREIVDFLTAPEGERTDADVAAVVASMHELGSVDFAQRYAAEMVADALRLFDSVFAGVPDSPHKDFLRDVISFVNLRSF